MTLEFISEDGQSDLTVQGTDAFLAKTLRWQRAERKKRLSAPQQRVTLRSIQRFLNAVRTGETTNQQDPTLEDEHIFRESALVLIRSRGLKVATLRVRSVLDYLRSYGEDSIIIEQALKDNAPNYQELLLAPSSYTRQVAYSPYQLLVPNSQNKGKVDQQASMDDYLERMFGLESGIALPWMDVWEGLSFHELVYQQDEVPGLADKAIRCANALPNNDYACLGRPYSEEDQTAGRLYLERWEEKAIVERLGVFAVFQPAPLDKAKEVASAEFWRKLLD